VVRWYGIDVAVNASRRIRSYRSFDVDERAAVPTCTICRASSLKKKYSAAIALIAGSISAVSMVASGRIPAGSAAGTRASRR